MKKEISGSVRNNEIIFLEEDNFKTNDNTLIRQTEIKPLLGVYIFHLFIFKSFFHYNLHTLLDSIVGKYVFTSILLFIFLSFFLLLIEDLLTFHIYWFDGD